MQDGEYDHALGFRTVEDGVREARNESAAHLAVHTRKHFWIALDGVEDRINGGKKLTAKAFGLFFVAVEPTGEVPSNLPTINNRQHR